MSFWEDASPVVKGAIAVGVVGLLYFGIAFVAELPPFGGGGDEEVTTERGLVAPGQGVGSEEGE